jgi:hypothetical protein
VHSRDETHNLPIVRYEPRSKMDNLSVPTMVRDLFADCEIFGALRRTGRTSSATICYLCLWLSAVVRGWVDGDSGDRTRLQVS